jgi:hypothetical protein
MPQRLLLIALLSAGASGLACSNGPPTPSPRNLPSDARQRDQVLATFGERLYTALASGRFDEVVANDRTRDALLKPEAARRPNPNVTSAKHGLVAELVPAEQKLWGTARYAGLCVQSGRSEPRAGVLGLRRPGFVFTRGLLIGREAGGGELAGWVEGVFVLTEQGFIALEIDHVEPPRRDHSDLELAECELADRRSTPQDVVSGAGSTH